MEPVETEYTMHESKFEWIVLNLTAILVFSILKWLLTGMEKQVGPNENLLYFIKCASGVVLKN